MLYKLIPQGHCMIVERFRKPVKVCQSGLHFFIPFLDCAKNVSSGRFNCGWGERTNKNGIFIELSEQITQAMREKKTAAKGLVRKSGPSKSQPVSVDTTSTDFEQFYTKDNVKVIIDCIYRWRVVDPLAAVYEVDHLHETLTKVVLCEIRSFVGSHELNFLLSSRQQFSDHIVTAVSDNVKKWGVAMISADIRKLELDSETKNAMRQQLDASRQGEAVKLAARGEADAELLKAEGEAVALERRAEADRKAAILRAQGIAESIRLRSEGEKKYLDMLVSTLGKESAAEVLLAGKSFGAFETIADSKTSKVYLKTPVMPVAKSS